MGEEEKARKELDGLLREHEQLNIKITSVSSTGAVFDQLLVQRMKRRKLWLRDRISILRASLCDDIIA